MNRRVLTGVLAGLLAMTALVGVAVTAFHAGRDRVPMEVVGPGGEAVRVVGYPHWGPPFGFFFPLFPLLVLGLVLFLVFGRRRAGWGGYGPCGPGSWGPGGGPGGREAMLADWHRRLHDGPGPGAEATGSAGQAPPGER
jgi:hypothetical protein